MVSGYTQTIRERLAKQGMVGRNPLHVEAWMRLEHGCLDSLSNQRFDAEVAIAVQCMDAAGEAQSEELAASYGLVERQARR